MSKGSLTILGLGPGPAGLLSLEAMERLRASTVILRTKIHPCVSDLEAAGVRYTSCDDLYETGQSFEDVYRSITERVLAAARTEDVVYAVPGSPLVAEKTVLLLRDAAREAGVPLTIKPALSFLDLAYVALGIDPINGLRIIDAQDYEALAEAGRYPLMVTQVYSPMVASDLKLAVMDVLPDDTEIWFLRNLGLPDEECRKIPLFEADRQPHIDHLTSIFIPPEAPLPAGEDTAAGGDPGTVPEAGKWLTDEDPYTPEEAQEDLENGEDAVWAEYSPLRRKTAFDIRPLADMIQTLREPNGCPWDREQDFHSIRANFIEECYEYLEALDQGDLDGMKEELGDVLMQVVFHARMAEEKGFFTLQDVVRGVTQKLLERHPHVFGSIRVDGSEEVLVNWDKIKEREKPERKRILDGIYQGLPALLRACKIQKKVAKVGFDWPDMAPVADKVREEWQEFREALAQGDAEARENELGDLLFALVNYGRHAGIEPETALNGTNNRFTRRFRHVEDRVHESGRDWQDFSLDELDAFWEEAKREEVGQA